MVDMGERRWGEVTKWGWVPGCLPFGCLVRGKGYRGKAFVIAWLGDGGLRVLLARGVGMSTLSWFVRSPCQGVDGNLATRVAKGIP